MQYLDFMWLTGAVLTTNLCALAAATGGDATPAPLGDMTLHVVPQSHIDLAWWWRYDPETLHVVAKHTLETAFENMEKYDDYTFTYLQVPAIAPMETLYPELFYKLRYYAHDKRPMGERLPNTGPSAPNGRLAIGSGLWCETDGCVPCGESLVRQCLYGKRYFLHEFGIDVKTAWFQDAWTHPWTFPQILKKSGMDSYMFSRPRGEGEPMFWWESPDGSRVFAYKPLNVFGEVLPPQQEIDAHLLDLNRKYGVKNGITLIGVGNHGGGAIRADVERMKEVMERKTTAGSSTASPPALQFSTPARFVDAVLQGSHDFPVIKNELEPTIRGAYTTVGEVKKGNRSSETLLMTLEKFSSVAAMLRERPYPHDCLFDAWKKVMLSQFHDTISGTDVPPSIDDALRRYAAIRETGQAELQACLQAICAHIRTEGNGIPVVVFNPLCWERTDLATIALECDTVPRSVRLLDAQGKPVATQITGHETRHGEHYVTFAFLAEAVPSLGYKVYWAAPSQDDPASATSLVATESEMENEFFRIRIDPATGCLASVYDKENECEILAATGRGNLIQVLEDFGDSEGFLKSPEGAPEHNVWTGQCWDVDTDPQMHWPEQGPVRAVLEVKKKFGLARFTQRVVLYPKIRRIEFDLTVDWVGTGKMVKVAFPLAVSSAEAAYEIPYGVIRRPSKGEEQAAQNWVDISQEDYGVGLLNDGRYGHDVTENVIRLSVLRSPAGPVAATDEKGIHQLRYALYPHLGTCPVSDVVRQGNELNYPLAVVLDTPHSGELPAAHSFVRAEPENVVMTVLKKAEDSDDLIMRCYETEGKAASVKVTLSEPLTIDAVHATDLLENSIEEIETDGRAFEAKVGAYSIETYKLIKDL